MEDAALFEQALTMVIIAMGFVLVVVSVVLPRLAKGREARAVASNRPEGSENELRALERVEDSTLELEETAREVFGRIDTRIRVLIQLIEEAEIRSKRIEELLRQHREGR